MAGTPEKLAAIFEASGLPLSAERRDLLWCFYELYESRNQSKALSSVVDFEAVVVKHLVDSILPSQWIDFRAPLLDIGTGPGFPGIPLKIWRPELEVILAEDRREKIRFLEDAKQVLALPGLTVYPQRVTAERFPKGIAAIVTRALEEIATTLKRSESILAAGSQVIFFKGPAVEKELLLLNKKENPHFRLLEDRSYELPILKHQRRLLIYERIA